MENIANWTEKNFEPIKGQFTRQIDEKAFRREINFAIQLLRKNSALQNCEAQSVLDAVLNISQTGLTLNPVYKYAYLIPRRGKCTLEPGYQGLIKLACESGTIISISVNLVYEGDKAEVDLASDKKIISHKPYMTLGNEKGAIVWGYSIAHLSDGSNHIEVMSRADIESVREYSESWKAFKSKGAHTIWNTEEAEMFRKTILKRHFKYLPKTDSEHLAKALELDNQDYDFPASYEQGNQIESLLMSAAIPEKTERQIYRALHDNEFTSKRASEAIAYLSDNQADHIDGGKTYNQGDIKRKLEGLKDID